MSALFWVAFVMMVVFYLILFRIVLGISRDLDSSIKECEKVESFAKELIRQFEKMKE